MSLSGNIFVGNQLKLAGRREEDIQVMARWMEDADYLRNVDTDIALPVSEKQLEAEGESDHREVYFRLRTVADDALIGFICIHSIEWNNRAGMLAVGIGEARHRNRGYGTEAVSLILRYAFHELNLNRVGLEVIAYNAGGIRAYEKAGFCHEGRIREAVCRDGRTYDRLMMGILRSEWERTIQPLS